MAENNNNDDDSIKLIAAIGKFFSIFVLSIAAASLAMNGRYDIAMYMGMGVVFMFLIAS